MSELKPCPLCGGTPLLSEGPYDWDCGGRYYYNAMIECACGLTLEVDNPGPKVYTSDAEALNFVVDAWNTRAERTCKMETDYDEIEVIASSPEDTWAYKCSACGWSFRYDRGIKPSYCPICGAKVVE